MAELRETVLAVMRALGLKARESTSEGELVARLGEETGAEPEQLRKALSRQDVDAAFLGGLRVREARDADVKDIIHIAHYAFLPRQIYESEREVATMYYKKYIRRERGHSAFVVENDSGIVGTISLADQEVAEVAAHPDLKKRLEGKRGLVGTLLVLRAMNHAKDAGHPNIIAGSVTPEGHRLFGSLGFREVSVEELKQRGVQSAGEKGREHVFRKR
jgi:N-acetylglutamate synthase-like GNAT family acetyltransferase